MSRLPIVTTGRLKTALRNATAARGIAGGFESVYFETVESSSTPEELRQLEAIAAELANEEDGNVLATRPEQLTSLLQSYLAEHEPIAEQPLNAGGFESTFDTHDVGWTHTALEWIRLKLKGKQPWVSPPEMPWEIPNNLRIAVLGDWGTGLYGAPECADSINRDLIGFDIHLHLGDVYYSGTKKEVEERFLAFWPQKARIGHLTTNSNHEMYCGGEGLFQATLPKFREWSIDPNFKQRSTCFAVQNDHLLLVGLDTGYVDHDLSNGQAEWLQRMVQRAKNRRVILFSHHQPYSLFEGQGPRLIEQLGILLTDGEVHSWYWGHEH